MALSPLGQEHSHLPAVHALKVCGRWGLYSPPYGNYLMSLTAARCAPLTLVQRILFGIQAFDQFEPPLGQRVSATSVKQISQTFSEFLDQCRPVRFPVCIGHDAERRAKRTVPHIAKT